MAKVFQTATLGSAHFRVAIVNDRGRADLLVHRVSSFGMAAGDARWFITRDQQMATAWVYFCSPGMADFNICFVDNYSEAGWQKPSPFKGRLG